MEHDPEALTDTNQMAILMDALLIGGARVARSAGEPQILRDPYSNKPRVEYFAEIEDIEGGRFYVGFCPGTPVCETPSPENAAALWMQMTAGGRETAIEAERLFWALSERNRAVAIASHLANAYNSGAATRFSPPRPVKIDAREIDIEQCVAALWGKEITPGDVLSRAAEVTLPGGKVLYGPLHPKSKETE